MLPALRRWRFVGFAVVVVVSSLSLMLLPRLLHLRHAIDCRGAWRAFLGSLSTCCSNVTVCRYEEELADLREQVSMLKVRTRRLP